jgi:guanidinopropionase
VSGTHINPFELCKIHDLGDVPLPNLLQPDLSSADIQKFYTRVYEATCTPISIGGDHSITLPILRAFKSVHPKEQIAVIHFDSHADAWPGAMGTQAHAGVCFKTAVEESIISPKHSFQIGFRGPTVFLNQESFSYEAGYNVLTSEEFFSLGVEGTIAKIRKSIGNHKIYISVDLDVLDPAYAPGVADPEIGGLTPMQLIKVIQGCRGFNVMGADIVCFCPRKDPTEITALAASEILLELTGITAESLHSLKK